VANSNSILDKYSFFIDAIKMLGYNHGGLSIIDKQASSVTKLFEDSRVYHLENTVYNGEFTSIVLKNKLNEKKYINEDPKWMYKYNSIAVVPIKYNARIIGFLTIESIKKNNFDKGYLEIIASIMKELLIEETYKKENYGSKMNSDSDDKNNESEFDAIKFYERSKKKNILILGKDTGEGLIRLKQIQKIVNMIGYKGLLVKEHPEIKECTNEDKVLFLLSISRFVICEDSFPSGHIDELKICSLNRIITARLRKEGEGSTFMQADYSYDQNYIKDLIYHDNKTLEKSVNDSVLWANKYLSDKVERLRNIYPWRS
jgi:GAF domain-containing protein